jgi:hypothetical protein
MTSTALLEDQVLKTDVLGRVRTPRQRREALLDEFEKSGMSGAKFAQFIGIKYSTWASWVQARGRERKARSGSSQSGPVRFVEAVVPTETSAANTGRSTLRLHLAGGAHLEIADRPQALLAAELLRALANSNAAASC